MVYWRDATVLPEDIPYDIRLYVPHSMDHEVSVSSVGRRYIVTSTGSDQADLYGGTCGDYQGDSIKGSCAYLCIDTTISEHFETGTVFEREDIPIYPAGVSGTEEAVLGETFVGGRILRADDWECYR